MVVSARSNLQTNCLQQHNNIAILSSAPLLSKGMKELDAYYRFIPNTSKALPVAPERKLSGRGDRSWWVRPLVPAAGHLCALILSPQTQQEIRGLLSVYPYISVAVQMERWPALQWQRDISREITHVWAACLPDDGDSDGCELGVS